MKKIKWFSKKVPSKDELYIRDIVVKFLEDKKIKKSIAPLSRTAYLQNDEKSIYIRIHYINNRVDICNHSFLYKKDVSSDMVNTLVELVEKKIEEEIKEIDEKLFVNEIELLKRIIKDER